MYIDFNKAIRDNDPKFKVDDVRISKYKTSFAKYYVRNWPEDISWLKKLKVLTLKVMKLLECFMKKNCKNQIKKSLELNK